MPRCRDLAIFVVTTDGQTDRQIDYFTPAHARGGNYSLGELVPLPGFAGAAGTYEIEAQLL